MHPMHARKWHPAPAFVVLYIGENCYLFFFS
jgi:hypothetical protein